MSRVFKTSKVKISLRYATEFHEILQEKDKIVKYRNMNTMNIWGDIVQRVGTCYKNLEEALAAYHNLKI